MLLDLSEGNSVHIGADVALTILAIGDDFILFALDAGEAGNITLEETIDEAYQPRRLR